MPSPLLLAVVLCNAHWTQDSQIREFEGITFRMPQNWESKLEDENLWITPKALKGVPGFSFFISPPRILEDLDSKEAIQIITKAAAKYVKDSKDAKVTEPTVRKVGEYLYTVQTVTLKFDGDEVREIWTLISRGTMYVPVCIVCVQDKKFDTYVDQALECINSITIKDPVDKKQSRIPLPPDLSPKKTDGDSKSTSKIPTGDTPQLSMGQPGWLPSGRGEKLPDPTISDDKPIGLWWISSKAKSGKSVYMPVAFTPSGIWTMGVILGGPDLIDIEAQKKDEDLKGYISPFSIKGDKMAVHFEGSNTEESYKHGRDSQGLFLEIDSERFRPLYRLTDQSIAGTWGDETGGEITYNLDGTGRIKRPNTSEDDVRQFTWTLEGYLVSMNVKGETSEFRLIQLIGQIDPNKFMLGPLLLTKKAPQ